MNLNIHPSDKEFLGLLQNCLAGDCRSQEKVYHQFHLYCTRICTAYIKDQRELEEVVNDGFVKIFMQLHRFDLSSSDIRFAFQGWIKKIMINTAIDHLRKYKHHLAAKFFVPEIVAVPCHDHVIEHIFCKEILEAIGRVSPRFRIVLKLFALTGCSHAEISKLLDITTSTSKSNLLRARKQLKTFLVKTERSGPELQEKNYAVIA